MPPVVPPNKFIYFENAWARVSTVKPQYIK
jgi:hypothetical protein